MLLAIRQQVNQLLNRKLLFGINFYWQLNQFPAPLFFLRLVSPDGFTDDLHSVVQFPFGYKVGVDINILDKPERSSRLYVDFSFHFSNELFLQLSVLAWTHSVGLVPRPRTLRMKTHRQYLAFCRVFDQLSISEKTMEALRANEIQLIFIWPDRNHYYVYLWYIPIHQNVRIGQVFIV